MLNVTISSVEELAKKDPKIQEMYERTKHIPELKKEIQEKIDKIISIFQQYDKIQLLGGLSLKHLPKIPLSDKDVPMLQNLYQEVVQRCSYTSCGFGLDQSPQDKMSIILQQHGFAIPELGQEFLGMKLEDDWNIIMEYALSFSSAIDQLCSEPPSHEIVSQLYTLLKETKEEITILEMDRSGSYEEDCIKFFSHLTTIGVRGDGYPKFIKDVFKGLFGPHDDFFKTKYGFTSEDVFKLVVDLDKRIYSKINNSIGQFCSWLRFRNWYDDFEKGNIHIVDDSIKNESPFEDFFRCNPDMLANDGFNFGLYDPKDLTASSKIFWITPNSVAEEKILSTFSHHFGENSLFIQEGEFKGFITNESVIYTRPFLQENNRFYCFSNWLPYVQLFEMMEFLLKQDKKYYDQNYQQNNVAYARDNYFEAKVMSVFSIFLPHARFYRSAHYNINFEECPKEPELDILGISDSAIYIIEVKAHELSHKDKIRIKGLKDKVKDSIGNGLRQCERSIKHIMDEDGLFTVQASNPISVNKTKFIYKIVVTFQQFTMFLTDYESYKKIGLLDSSIDNTLVISLFDLMPILENMKDEQELIQYLDIRKEVNKNKILFCDELDLFGYFKEGMLGEVVRKPGAFIMPITPSKLDEKYLCKSFAY
jgi:hypothetical protein